jgi:3-hydroxyisobutyrate dehydrogenase
MSASESKPRVGFVGVGRMGANMAMRLHDCGFPISSLYDTRIEAASETAQATGATVASDLAQVTEQSDVIITVVSDDAAMLHIFAPSGDTLLRAATGKLFINCATVTPAVHVEAQRRAIEAGAEAIEACMASSITQARDGSLYLIVAGERASYDRAVPILEALSSSLRYTGAAGSAAQVKALVNMVMNINTAGLAEGLGLGEALGLDLAMLREVFAQTGAASRVLQTDGEDMEKRDHAVFFSAAHAAKDSHIAVSLATQAGLRLPLARATAAQYDRMIALDLGELDKSGVAELTFLSRRADG